MNYISMILIIALVFSVIVFVHEYGHFWVARKNGVQVDEFSIGFGPEVFGWTDKLGTRWKICPLPFGGYVKMHGDADASSKPSGNIETSERHLTLEGKTPLQRIAVASAGPIANFIFTLVAFCFLFSIKGITVVEPIIQTIAQNSIAERIGLQINDHILALDGKPIDDFLFFRKYLKEKQGETVKVKVLREKKEKIFDVELVKINASTGEKTPSAVLGFSPTTTFKPVPVLEGLTEAVTLTVDLIYRSFVGIISLITLQEKSTEMGGLLTIGDQISKAADHGFWTLLEFMAFLSLQLGVINLLPIPVLDGGHILMNAIEIVIRRPVHQKIQECLYRIGLFIVLSLMIYANFSDLRRYTAIDKVLTFVGIGSK